MRRKDYYQILGVARDADENEIKIAYRRLAFRNHPDTNRNDPQAEDRFKEISEAYEILGQKEKRDLYDRGRDPLAAGSPLRPHSFDPWSDPFEECSFSKSRCRGGGFGRGLGRKRPFRGTGARPVGFVSDRPDLPIHDLPLTSEEAALGTQRDIRLHTGRDTLIFTVSIPAGVENGTLLSFRQSVGQGHEMEFLFRVRIMEDL